MLSLAPDHEKWLGIVSSQCTCVCVRQNGLRLIAHAKQATCSASFPGYKTPSTIPDLITLNIPPSFVYTQVVHNPRFSLGSGEAEAAWARACLPEEEQRKLVRPCMHACMCERVFVCMRTRMRVQRGSVRTCMYACA